jgi:PAS domain S-box-containing protein
MLSKFLAVFSFWIVTVLLNFAAFAKPAQKPDSVNLQLKWRHQFQFAGYYAALKNGYYAEQGLKVNILEGNAKRPPVQTVLKGKAEYGITGADIIDSYIAGEPVVVLSVIYQHSPYVFLSLSTKKISAPSDLSGKTIMASNDQGWLLLRAVLLREGIPLKSVKIIPHTWNNMDLVKGKADALTAYSTVEPQQFRNMGYAVNLIRPIDYGIDLYGDLIFTTEKEIEDHPGRAEKFKNASNKGWDYAMSHVDEMADYILTLPGVKERGITRELLLNEAEESSKLILPDLVEIGHMNPGRWERILDIYKDLGMAQKSVVLKRFLYEAPDKNDNQWLKIAAWASAISLLVIAIIILHNRNLQRKVDLKTSELVEENRYRQEAEKSAQNNKILYEIAVEGAGLGVFMWDIPSKKIDFNNQWAAMLGYESAEIVNKSITWLSKIHPDELEKVKANILLFFGSGDDQFKFEHRLKTKSGNWKWILSFIKVQERNEKGKPAKVSGVHVDISDIKARQFELQKITQELTSTNSELQKFAYITSHNLRAPAVNLLSLSELYNYDDPANELNIELARKIKTCGIQLNDTLNDLIEIVSNKPGDTESRVSINLMQECEVVFSSIECMIKSNQVQINLNFAKLPSIMYSRKVIHSIILNMVSNAIKYRANDRPAVINIRSYELEGLPFIDFTDNGLGIDLVKHKAKIFGLYQRFHRNVEGKGLGLFIVKSQVESMNGTIAVKSQLDKGTTFTIGLNKEEPIVT